MYLRSADLNGALSSMKWSTGELGTELFGLDGTEGLREEIFGGFAVWLNVYIYIHTAHTTTKCSYVYSVYVLGIPVLTYCVAPQCTDIVNIYFEIL
jgi:hypothetical protein